jgi:hypothetical protein
MIQATLFQKDREEEEKKLEFAYFTLGSMTELPSLKNLSQLRILCQDIETMEGLQECEQLTHLWVCETQIKEIAGLEKCVNLKHLFL